VPLSKHHPKVSTIADHTVIVPDVDIVIVAGGRPALAKSRRCCPI